MHDTYKSLTVKVLLGLKEMKSTCKFLFKVDEDFNVIVENFVKLVVPVPRGLVYGGYIYDQHYRVSEVDRGVPKLNEEVQKITMELGVNSFSREEFMLDYFTPYAGGPVYLTSSGTVRLLPYSVSSYGDEKTPSLYLKESFPLFRLEDVYVSRLVSSTCSVTFLHVSSTFSAYPNKANSSTAVGQHRGQ